MTKEETDAEDILRAFAYVWFKDEDTRVVDRQEWEGEEDSPGVRYYVQSKLRDIKRLGYMKGYFDGAVGAFEAATIEEDPAFSEEDNKIGAERDFLKWERDDERF